MPKVRRITSWTLRRPDDLTDVEWIGLKQVLASCRHLEVTAAHVTACAEILTERRGENLNPWIAAIRAYDLPQLHRFVRGLETDHDAVRSGLTLTYSSGGVEGHVNWIIPWESEMSRSFSFALVDRDDR